MSVQATDGDARTVGAWSAPGRALRLEKPRRTASAGDPEQHFEERRGPKPTRRNAYRFDTAGVSAWDGPSLRAAYAAQVIGQALPALGETLPRTAYREPARRLTLFLDRRL
jgi:hypothetical protein